MRSMLARPSRHYKWSYGRWNGAEQCSIPFEGKRIKCRRKCRGTWWTCVSMKGRSSSWRPLPKDRLAIKCLRVNGGSIGKTFKVPSMTRVYSYFSPHLVAMPRDYRSEALAPPEYPTFVGGLYICGPGHFQDTHGVDAQQECDAVHAIQSKGKPFEIREAPFFSAILPSSTGISQYSICTFR